MSGTISPRDRLQLWVNTFLLKQKENSGSVTATFRDKQGFGVPSQQGKDWKSLTKQPPVRKEHLCVDASPETIES